ncbi:MAG: alpha-glucan family phosphorylase [Candidatus Omnitrophica bacterium]|nr:alpha-glucan family phosphorylase [Candidatus Omnitrophota bacterium]
MDSFSKERIIAYFSMEIGVKSDIPTYSGGLGVLAGDTVRAAADMGIPLVGITLLHRKGYFHQKLDPTGWQTEQPERWDVADYLEKVNAETSVVIEGRTVYLRAWRFEVVGAGGHKVPVYFLDSDLSKNSEADRSLTDYLYGGDQRYRLCQETILGIGGVKMLRSLSYRNIQRFHMNEGHSSLLVLELLTESMKAKNRKKPTPEDFESVRSKCVFTTHTPVPAGHDQFPAAMADGIIGDHRGFDIRDVLCSGDVLNMTYLALNFSHYVNGVAKKHGEVSRQMFFGYEVDAITNGVHAGTWVSDPIKDLFDHYIPGWREDNLSLRGALSIPKWEIWEVHRKTKHALLDLVNAKTGSEMDMDTITLGFARRATAYKRADLLLRDPDRLRHIVKKAGPIQVIFAGKAHPADHPGKELIKRIYQMQSGLKDFIKIAYLEDYDMALGKLMTSGVDVWLNTPEPPLEASGTSGMKAALNGVPSLSVLDGWWVEGWIEGVTGWAIGPEDREAGEADSHKKDAESLYEKLEQKVLPAFYKNRDQFIDIMRHSVALNGSFFNTQRMMQQYVLKAYFF